MPGRRRCAPQRKETPLSGILPGLVRGLQKEGRLTREEIQGVWSRIAGEKAARHSAPASLRKGRLIVEVDSSGWMYALGTQKTALLQGLVECVGARRINGLSFRIGEIKPLEKNSRDKSKGEEKEGRS